MADAFVVENFVNVKMTEMPCLEFQCLFNPIETASRLLKNSPFPGFELGFVAEMEAQIDGEGAIAFEIGLAGA